MSEIKKIKILKTKNSDEKIENLWKEVKSFRIKLLQDSDWVFVQDSNLTQNCITEWIQWRDKVKHSKTLTDHSIATEYLLALSLNKPQLQYINEKPKTIDSYKKLLYKALSDSLKDALTNINDELGHRDIILEKFNEALNYKNGIDNYILIDIESSCTGEDLFTVADRAISNRHKYLEKLVKIEKAKHSFKDKIDNVENIEECDRLLEIILRMAEKKWILT